MKKIIYFMFGKPKLDNKFYNVFYWFGVVFYFLALVLFVLQASYNGEWLTILFPIIGFPLLFRFVYGMNTRIHKSVKGINLCIIFIIVAAVVILNVGILALIFIFGENTAINTSKSVVNGNVNLSIGSLKGYYDVETLEISETPQETITIPYQASAEEGSFLLSVEHADQTVWQEEVLSEENGLMEFEGEKGTYEINIFAEEAKKININLLLQ